MAGIRWLSRAPLVEARIELTASLPGEPRDDLLDALTSKLAEKYPRIERDGGRCRLHGDAPYFLDAGAEGLRVSRLPPYSGFGPLVGEALWAWERYVELAKPARIRRIAVRFDNRFQLRRGVPLDRLFVMGAALDEVVARATAGKHPGTRAAVTQRADDGDGADDRVWFVLDIEMEEPVDLPPESDAVWRSLGELTVMEHRIFFDSVTDEALAPYV